MEDKKQLPIEQVLFKDLFTRQEMCEFADWYCNGLSNSERKSTELMIDKFICIKNKKYEE